MGQGHLFSFKGPHQLFFLEVSKRRVWYCFDKGKMPMPIHKSTALYYFHRLIMIKISILIIIGLENQSNSKKKKNFHFFSLWHEQQKVACHFDRSIFNQSLTFLVLPKQNLYLPSMDSAPGPVWLFYLDLLGWLWSSEGQNLQFSWQITCVLWYLPLYKEGKEEEEERGERRGRALISIPNNWLWPLYSTATAIS